MSSSAIVMRTTFRSVVNATRRSPGRVSSDHMLLNVLRTIQYTDTDDPGRRPVLGLGATRRGRAADGCPPVRHPAR